MSELIEFLYSKFLQSDGVSTDTRNLRPGEMFFALSGPNFNGNVFAQKALEAGATCAVIDDAEYSDGDRTVLVEDTLKALQDLSRFHRSRFKRPVFALTGSNGKTSTKELIAGVLSKKYQVLATEGNLNNHIGVPLTLLKIHPQVEVAVIEMGASSVGEIAELCSFAQPTHGLITNIGRAHTETFGGIEGVLRGKSELFDFLRQNGGVPFINTSDPRLSPMVNRFEEKEVFPPEDMRLVEAEPYITFEMADKVYTSYLIGEYNYANVAAAVSVGRHFGVEDWMIGDVLSSYVPADRRSQVISKGGLGIIVDAYNANPDSMMAALDSFSKMKGTKTAVLGDMLELEDEEGEHRRLGEWLETSGIEQVFLLGPLMKFAAEEVKRSEHFESYEDLRKRISSQEFAGGFVLLKGSRKMALERLVDDID